MNLFLILKNLIEMCKITDPTKLYILGWRHKIKLSQCVLLNYNYYLKIEKMY